MCTVHAAAPPPATRPLTTTFRRPAHDTPHTCSVSQKPPPPAAPPRPPAARARAPPAPGGLRPATSAPSHERRAETPRPERERAPRACRPSPSAHTHVVFDTFCESSLLRFIFGIAIGEVASGVREMNHSTPLRSRGMLHTYAAFLHPPPQNYGFKDREIVYKVKEIWHMLTTLKFREDRRRNLALR